MFVQRITINFDENGLLGATVAMAEVIDDGRVRGVGRRPIEAADLAALMPDAAALVAQVDAVTRERNQAQAEVETLKGELAKQIKKVTDEAVALEGASLSA